jgi:hypothetical protein
MNLSNINKAHIFGERVIRPPSCPVAVLVLLLELEVSADLLLFFGELCLVASVKFLEAQ